jgi:cell division protein FtsL
MNALARFFRSLAAVLIVLSVPAFLWMGMSRATRHAELRSSISSMEEEQRELVDENKRLISEISGYESPERIGELADGKLGLKKAGPADILRVELGE